MRRWLQHVLHCYIGCYSMCYMCYNNLTCAAQGVSYQWLACRLVTLLKHGALDLILVVRVSVVCGVQRLALPLVCLSECWLCFAWCTCLLRRVVLAGCNVAGMRACLRSPCIQQQ
jgi:hypothetical protein